jgi:serine protease Do
MKPSVFSRNFLLLALAVTLGAGRLVLWAKDRAEERPPLKLQLDAKPIDRDTCERVSYASVVKKTAPSVVYVFSSKKVRQQQAMAPFLEDPMFRRFFGVPGPGEIAPRESIQHGLGSGVIVTTNGYILTNNHVIDGADEVKVAVGEPRQEYQATVVGRDPKVDVAVLKIDATGLPAATLGDSDQLQVGDVVLAIGNPFGIGLTVTHGIVSAVGRGGLGIEDYEDFIQTDAPINPGNSGGALLDSQGRVVGINTAILSRSGGFNGVGFAIPINLARSLAEQLVRTGRVERGFLGINLQELTPDLAAQFGVAHGALITDVSPNTPAQKAGLKSGDIITRLNGAEVTDPRHLALTVGRLLPGVEVTVDYIRDGKSDTKRIRLAAQPATAAAAGENEGGSDKGVLNGVSVGDITPEARAELHIPRDLDGAIITGIDPASASARAGLREGDVITELDRQPVHNADEAVKKSEEIKGPKVIVRLWRNGFNHYAVVDESK